MSTAFSTATCLRRDHFSQCSRLWQEICLSFPPSFYAQESDILEASSTWAFRSETHLNYYGPDI